MSGDGTGGGSTAARRMAGADGARGGAARHYWGARPAAGAPAGPAARRATWDFALWAPSAAGLTLHLDGRAIAMERGADGVHRARADAVEGMPYHFSTAAGLHFADPASRRQAAGAEGPSLLVDPRRLRAGRRPAPARAFSEAVIAEIHIGSFTPEGTFAAAAAAPQLRRLADTGITVIELMPLGQFPGTRGWGYDGVLPHAPQHSYGTPEDLCALIDAAHDLGLSVWLDVVFNHFGPEGCHLVSVCPEFFLPHSNVWGRVIDFTRPPVREYAIGCAMQWIGDYGFDGLRLDAVHAIEDPGEPDIVTEIATRLRAAFPERPLHLVAEDSANRGPLYDPANRLYDAQWNDDYHHALHILLTGETFGYYGEFRPDPLEGLATALAAGYAAPEHAAPGHDPARLPPHSFVNFNLNHDHAGNRPGGERLLALAGQERALVAHALLLTAPFTPMLFMGEEIGAETPFPWFGDFSGELAEAMRRGRLEGFAEIPEQAARMIDPFAEETLHRACPYRTTPPAAARWLDSTRRLLALRRERLAPLFGSGWRGGRGQALPPAALTVEWRFAGGRLRVAAGFGGGADVPLPAAAPDFALGRTGGDTPFFALWTEG